MTGPSTHLPSPPSLPRTLRPGGLTRLVDRWWSSATSQCVAETDGRGAFAAHRLHLAFLAAINEPLEHEDPSDRLLDVETQLGRLREHGFDDVDCYWKWLEMALLVGVKPDELR